MIDILSIYSTGYRFLKFLPKILIPFLLLLKSLNIQYFKTLFKWYNILQNVSKNK